MPEFEIQIGTVISTEVGTNRSGKVQSRLVKVELTDPEDIQTVQLYTRWGEDYNPPAGAKIAVLFAGEAWAIGFGIDDEILPAAAVGEKWIYALDPTGLTAIALLKLLTTGIIEINGNTDSAVAYLRLKVAFDQLKADHDLAMSYITAHSHNDSLGAPTTSPLLPNPPWPAPGLLPSTADMTPAEVPTVKVP